MNILPTRAIALLAGMTVVIVAGSTALLASEMRKRDLERERLDTASLAHMLREETERTFDAADKVLRGVQERMETGFAEAMPLDGPGVRLLLGARVLAAPQVDLLAITDADGRVVNASRDDASLSQSIAPTAYFSALSQGRAEGLVIDRPVRDGADEWTLDMARAFKDSRGNFRGVVVLTMHAPRLEDFQQHMDPGHARPLALYLADGTLVASAPPRSGFVGERPPELGTTVVRGNQVQTVVRTDADGTSHAMVLAGSGALPLFVSVSSDDDIALAQWREQAFSIALGALGVCLFTIAGAAAIAGELRREARLTQALRDANDRYHRTVESLMDAIVSVDATGRITLFNPAAERMFGIAVADALGAPVERLIPRRARRMHATYMERFVDSKTAPIGMQANPDVAGVRADGTEFPLETSLARTTVDGRPEVTAVLRDVTDRRRAERELKETNRQLRALSISLQDVREQERTRIAAELHDELGQQLTGLKLELSWLVARVRDGRGAGIEQLDAMRHQLDATIGSVRRIATELRPRVLDDRALGEALEWQADEFTRRTGVAVQVSAPAAATVHDDAMATAIFRIAQESLTNVARHAQAKSVRIVLEERDERLVLRIADDGCGLANTEQGAGGLGLVGMRERALALGGRFDVRAQAGQGTTIEVSLPPDASIEEAQEPA